MTRTISKLNRCDLSNTACCECLPKKTNVMWYYIATEGLLGSTNKSDCFNYKGDWANV